MEFNVGDEIRYLGYPGYNEEEVDGDDWRIDLTVGKNYKLIRSVDNTLALIDDEDEIVYMFPSRLFHFEKVEKPNNGLLHLIVELRDLIPEYVDGECTDDMMCSPENVIYHTIRYLKSLGLKSTNEDLSKEDIPLKITTDILSIDKYKGKKVRYIELDENQFTQPWNRLLKIGDIYDCIVREGTLFIKNESLSLPLNICGQNAHVDISRYFELID